MSRRSVRQGTAPPGMLRPQLLGFVAEFLGTARAMAGVERIAMIGSLTTSKPNPKDIDLVVEVAEDVDLAALARAARRLQGRAQGLNQGADVFLAAADGTYLGRTCHWRDCRPGIRASCDAQHCGRRAHLHDDLGTVTLPRLLLAQPPLELWPRLVVRAPLPADVAGWLARLHLSAA